MTVAPKPLLQLIGGTRVASARDAVKDTLVGLLPGVTVVSHPGKADINDYVQKAIVSTPGVAVGYTRLRQDADPGGTWSDVVDFIAYIVAEPYVDRSVTPPRTHGQELVALAIGGQILAALRDPALCFWGLTGVLPPSMDPGPVLVPVFTMKAEQNMTAVYAVIWSQALVQDGTPFFDGPSPAVHGLGGPDDTADGIPGDVAGDDEVVFDLPPGAENDYPPEILAYIRRGGPLPGEGGGSGP